MRRAFFEMAKISSLVASFVQTDRNSSRAAESSRSSRSAAFKSIVTRVFPGYMERMRPRIDSSSSGSPKNIAYNTKPAPVRARVLTRLNFELTIFSRRAFSWGSNTASESCARSCSPNAESLEAWRRITPCHSNRSGARSTSGAWAIVTLGLLPTASKRSRPSFATSTMTK